MDDPFHSSKYSVQHAKRHVATFEAEVGAFFNSRPYASVIETNADRTEDFHKIKLIRPMPVALSGIAFDVVNNLRPALDQACHAVAVDRTPKGLRQCHFPFGDSFRRIKWLCVTGRRWRLLSMTMCERCANLCSQIWRRRN